MKIAIVTSRYPKKDQPYNHMFVHVRSLYFKSQNEDITVFVPSAETSNYVIDGIDVVCDSGRNIAGLLSDFDIVYLHLLNVYPLRKDSGHLIYKKLLKLDVPVAMYIHGSEVLKYPKHMHDFIFGLRGISKVVYRNFWHFPVMKRIVNNLNKKQNVCFMFPSKWMKDIAEENFSMKLNNSFLIPNGIDPVFFETNKKLSLEPRKIVTIRSFSTKVYNIDQTIDVLERLPSDYTLDIYGEGRLLPKYEKMIKERNLGDRVRIIPKFLNRDSLKDIFIQYDIFISTTLFDSQGVTMLEAMASGLLLAATNNSSREEFIKDGITGILGDSTQDLANKIIEVTQSQEVYKKIIEQGQKSMEEISVEKVGFKELEVLKNLVK